MTRIFVFPGQGSQQAGMGADLFPRFAELVAQADAILGYSVADLCARDPEGRLGQTQYTQPALFVVNALSHLARVAAGEQPQFLAGHSLGEYNALFAAGVFDFATGVKLVQRRGALMAQAQGGGMAAVLGLDAPAVARVLAEQHFDTIDVANYNAPTQTVISGPRADVERAQTAFMAAGARMYVLLKVSGAFHSRYMAAAATEFGAFLRGFTFQAPRVPVIANADAQPYAASDVADKLTRQITHGVRWTDTVERLLREPEAEFIEVGPGNVLTKLIRQCRK